MSEFLKSNLFSCDLVTTGQSQAMGNVREYVHASVV